MTRDELFIALAVQAKLLSPAQLDDCHKLREMLAGNAFALSLPEIAAKKEFLNAAQIRLINIAIRYEEIRREDEDLSAFIVKKGFLPQEKINECLAAQAAPFKDGRHFPRLADLLIQKGALTLQQMHVILRAREQLDQQSHDDGSSPRVPQTQPAIPQPPPERPAKSVSPQLLKTVEGGLKLETLKVTFRKARIGGERFAAILELAGAIDGHTSLPFDQYLQAVLDAGFVHLVLVCEKLDYISSAGIGVLAGTIKRSRDGSGDVRLCNVDEKMRRVMQIIGLLSLVRSYESEKGAVASFKYG